MMRSDSIRKALKFTNIVMILASIVPFIINTLYYNITLNQYEGIIENVYSANSLSSNLKNDIYTTMWNIVTGKTTFKDNTQYALIGRIRENLDELEKNANSEDNGYLVQVARNTLETMESYVNSIGDNIARERPVRENEELLGEIASVSDLLYDVIQKFVAAEMELAHIQNAKIRQSMDLMTLTQVLLFFAILMFLLRNYRQLNRRINEPIWRLKTMASRIAQGDLSIRVEKPEISELDELTDSLNTMAEKLIKLIDQNVQKQRNLQKAEMKALQAQIAPHFMYNTLGTILSLAEDGQTENVVTTTLALSSFFRLSLNKGRDWVTVAEEKAHVENYLAIQKMRYGAILEYDFDFSPEILKESMLKLLLQPLVENAIYHGIKKTRRRGHIAVKGTAEGDSMIFTVQDNGLGMTPEELEKLQANLLNYDVSSPGSGFGLYNVYKRIELYYETGDGLTVESEYDKGCTITLRLPIVRTQAAQPAPDQTQAAPTEGA
ncbi:histidine kinase [Treponema zuelzerae]|uniref:histidine kinase n=1 Tax=Teretinema zuelzerae TaxID=156 RepID=A0AAE3JHS9_9SPIR|nr:histidine kinase [Teretinema zuelzerae]MCD1653368.1 histidine kinase [Teretinema zuelzerae]